ncbi:hypothetical protein L2E82_37034 [Cichorium intybus]|uniref:Uncharacterized protein n=1 Tax=Cichorium intybus TaxID=13427 RepID=A0ACB9AD13_CICIN|nr:hypothetical protein L2E82_37034 [Cichorium intybus]
MASTTNSTPHPQLPKLNGRNYYHWSIQMKVLFESQDLWDVVKEGYEEPEDLDEVTDEEESDLKEIKKRDRKALFMIYQAVDEVIFERISSSATSKEAWDMLYKTYRGEDKVKVVRLQTLRCEFDGIKMRESETVEDFYNRVILLLNQLRLNGETIEDTRVVEKILRSLTRRFEYIVVAIEESKDLSTLSLESLLGTLQSHELRMKQFDSPTYEQAFQFQSSNAHENSKEIAKYDQNDDRGKGKAKSLSQVQCHYCQKFGHVKKFCRKRIADEKGTTFMHKEEGNDDDTMFMILSTQDAQFNDMWYIDSGCSNHMCGNKDLFTQIDDSLKREVRTGDDKKLDVYGIGEIIINTKQGNKRIQSVYYVPELKHNLLSVGQLLQKNYELHFKENSCMIKDPKGNMLGKISMSSNKMFPINFKENNLFAFNLCTNKTSLLWHHRFGHTNMGYLSYMYKHSLVKGIPNVTKFEGVCEGCMLGKQTRESFPQDKAWRATEQLELVHTDVCGPMRTPSIGGSRYLLTFIDDFSRKLWVYFLKEKSEVFYKFKVFKTLVEKQSGHEIKAIRSDGGGEYNAKYFKDFLIENGIHHQVTTRYTPQQNGVAERKNRSIIEMARSMLKAKNLDDSYWGEAVACACYLLNRTSTKSLPNMTPQEAWSGYKPCVAHLRTFGCIAYSHIPEQKRSKLESKSEKAIFVGYSENSKAYKLYNPITKNMIISRDVAFEEEKCWDNSVIQEENHPQILQDDNSDDTRQIHEDSPISTPSTVQTPSPSSDNRIPQNSQSTMSTLETPPRKSYRNLNRIYANSRRIDLDDVADFALFSDADPLLYEDACLDKKWRDAMDEEMKAILKNNTWELVDLPEGHKSIGVKWVYKTKLNERGEIDKHKARLVVKGYKQKYGIDYQEVFAPVIRLETIRLVLALAAQKEWKVHQMDVKSAFLNGTLKENVYIDQPIGYIEKGNENKVCHLKKALYGLKQAPRAWYSRIESYFIENGFRKCPQEHTLFIQEKNGMILIVCIYVDDLVFTGNSHEMIEEFKASMKDEFDMTDMGLLHYFLGIEVKQKEDKISICQERYARSILDRFNMSEASPGNIPMEYGSKLSKFPDEENVDPGLYRSLVGCLMYLTATRPDLMFAVSIISRYMECPKVGHWEAGKRILKYVKGTVGHGIVYSKVEKFSLIGFSDSDFGGNPDDSRSTSGYIFTLGSGAISWQSKKQSVVALSSAEAEYMSLSLAGCQAIWLRGILEELSEVQESPTKIFCDNKSAIALSMNPVFHGKSKHIRIKFHFIRELIRNGEINVEFCGTKDQLADCFTKALQVGSFHNMKERLGVHHV